MEKEISYRKIWTVAYPIILGTVAQNLINITDTAFLGRVGEIELGASALGGIYYLIVVMLGMGFGTGAQIIIARRYGEKEYQKLGSTFDHALFFMISLGFISLLLMYFFSKDILSSLVTSEKILDKTIEFVHWRQFGVAFAFIQITLRSLFVGVANTKVITWSTLLMAVVNIFLDYGLIFGELGFPELGLKGAAIASVIAEFVSLSFMIIYAYRMHFVRRFNLLRFRSFDKGIFLNNLRVSYPLMIQNFLSFSVWFVFFLLVEKMGERDLAISNIIRSAYVVLMIPLWGFASASNSLTSYLIGLKREHLIKTLIRRILWLSNAGVAVLILFSFVFPKLILAIYTNDQSLIDASIPVLNVVNVGALALSFGFVIFNGVLGTGKTNLGLFIEIIVLVIYLSYIFILVEVFQVSLSMVWTSEIMYGLLMATISWIYLNKWLKSHEASKS